jgi:hypothetical protein
MPSYRAGRLRRKEAKDESDSVCEDPIYDWVTDSGYANFSDWVERAAKAVGR